MDLYGEDADLAALALACTFSGLGIPVPEDVPLVLAGTRLAEGALRWEAVLPVAFGSVLLRDSLAYGLGRLLGDRLLTSTTVARVLGAKRIARARRLVSDQGAVAVLVGRVLVGFRVPVFVVAGASGLPFRRFFAFDLAGLLVTIPTALLLGATVGAPLLDAMWAYVPRSREAFALLTLGAAALVWSRARRRARLRAASAGSSEAPTTSS
jgi:membrane-associated protein